MEWQKQKLNVNQKYYFLLTLKTPGQKWPASNFSQ